MNCIAYQAAYNFINAWKRWDEVITSHSISANIARRNGRSYRMSRLALQNETTDFHRTREILAYELGVTSSSLLTVLTELREEGTDHAKAVRLVIDYLEYHREAS